MRSPNCIILLLVFFLFSCEISLDRGESKSRTQGLRGVVSNAGLNGYTEIKSNGVAIEHTLPAGDFLNAYNNDNFIYRPGRSWRYKISLAENNQLKVLEVNRKGDWRLSPANGKISRQWKRVNELVLDVVDGYGPYDADHNETVIKYSYRMNGNDDGNESFTGLVENDANVWIHPLRKDYFEILALNPYPFIKHPVRVGQRFNFKIPIPESWSNPEWQKWYGTLNNNCRYEIVKQRSVTLPFGDISPFAVMSNCDNELGSTGLIAYYDEAMGFVKMDYRNIDGSWLSLELIEPPF